MARRTLRGTWRAVAPLGFTLIELLVVVSVIVLLIALLMPALARSREQGRRAVCLSNNHQLGVGVYAYAQEYRHRLPWIDGIYYSTTPFAGPYHLSVGGSGPVGAGLFLKAGTVGDPRAFYCPSMQLNWAAYEPNWTWTDAQQIAMFGYDMGFPDQYCYTSYEYARWVPGWNPFPISPGQQSLYAPHATIDRLGNDAIFYDSFYANRGAFAHREGYSVTYGDGHARFWLDIDQDLAGPTYIDLPSVNLNAFREVILDMNRY